MDTTHTMPAITRTHLNLTWRRGWRKLTIPSILTDSLMETAYMDATAINRKLKELDQLEERVRQTVNPSAVLLKKIAEERQELLNPKPENLK